MNSGLGLPFSGSYWTAVALFGCSEEGLIFRDILRASALIGVLGTAVAHATPATAKCAVVSACICDRTFETFFALVVRENESVNEAVLYALLAISLELGPNCGVVDVSRKTLNLMGWKSVN